MSEKLKVLPSAHKERKKLDNSIQSQFKRKLKECLGSPHVPSCLLSGFKGHYKIKVRASGYRLVDGVVDKDVLIIVIAIGIRTKT